MDNFFHDIIECLVAALDAKDPYTRGHSIRVGDMAFDIASRIGLSDAEAENIHIAGHLHDIGKIGVPGHILNKDGKLSEFEWAQMKLHPEKGFNILMKSDKLREVALMVLHHHERWDGKGYPQKLSGTSIPLGARIIAISDTIDAMTSNRPYRSSYSWEECRGEILTNAGTQFDPELIEAAIDLWPSWKRKYSGKRAAGCTADKTDKRAANNL